MPDGGGERGEDVGDLAGQLTGRDEDETAGVAGLAVDGEALEDGDAEGEGLAGPGLRLAADVTTGEGVRDRQGLDGEGVGNAARGEGLDEGGEDPELRKALGFDERRG